MLGDSHLPRASYFEIQYYFPIQLQGMIYVKNSRKHWSAVCQKYSISTEIQSSHKHVVHSSLCWQPPAAPVCNLWSNSSHPVLGPFLIQGHLSNPALKCGNEKQNKWILESRTAWEVGKSWFPVRENIFSCCNWPTKGEEKVLSLRNTAE